jgi:plastocyanin
VPTETAAAAVSTPAGADTFEITMLDDRFDPVAATIPAGTTVVWVNKGRNWHSVASFDGSFESGQIQPGDRFEHRFDTAGAFKYICKHHGLQGMLGTITVVAASG